MTNQLLIDVKDPKTAEMIQGELAAQGIRFGMRISGGGAALEITPEEITRLASSAPTLVDALFDTLERFRERITLFVNGQPKEVPVKWRSSRVRPLTIEEFMRGETGLKR